MQRNANIRVFEHEYSRQGYTNIRVRKYEYSRQKTRIFISDNNAIHENLIFKKRP